MTLKNQFVNGPFDANARNIEDFANNLYFSYVFLESIQQHQRLQEEYIDAFLEADEKTMAEKESQIARCESAFEMTAMLIDSIEELFS